MPGSANVAIAACNVDLRVQRAGAGAPLVFLPDAHLGAAWLPFHDRLAADFEVVLLEHPGYGGGDAPPWLERVTDLANFYLDALAQLDLAAVHLVGAALGGWVAAELAIRNTARLRSLALIDPWGLRVDGAAGIDLFARSDEQQLFDLTFDRQKTEAVAARILAPDNEDALLKGRTVTAKLAWQPRLFDPALGHWLHRIDVPTLILWGREDRLLPAACGAAWQAAIPGARLATVANAGHWPHVEQPAETAGLVHDFIAHEGVAP